MIEHDPKFLVETWTLYAVGASLLIARFAARLRTVGIRNFQGDDYFSAAVLVFYTLDALLVHITYFAGTNVDFTQSEIDAMSDSQRATVTYGSKMELFAWYSYTALIWCLKGTMICFFQRLTLATKQQQVVKWIAVGCALSYLAVFITLSAGCRPYSGNWQVNPLPSDACTAKKQNFITTAVFNVITDAALLTIPLPLLWKLKVPLKQKLVIAVLLSSGVFVITAAIVRVVFSLGPHPSVLTVNRWGVRETIVGIISVNIPIMRPVFRREFWSTNRSLPTSNSRSGKGQYGLGTMKPSRKARNSTILGDNDSSDLIVGNKNEVLVETTIEVRTENDLESGSSRGTGGDWKFEEDGKVETRRGL